MLPVKTKIIGAGGYIYGFPGLLMEETAVRATTAPYPCGLGAPMNTFKQLYDRPGPDFRAVVRPNVDTLYSSAFLDLSEGPVVLDIPKIKDRFYLFAMLDAWSNNFAGPGSASTGGKAAKYVIVGPDWEGELPARMEPVYAPTNLVWIIGRTEVRGGNDIKKVNALQRRYRLTPLTGHKSHEDIGECQPIEGQTSPEDVIRSLDATTFFSRLDKYIEENPPQTDDEDRLKSLMRLGVGDGDGALHPNLRRRDLKALNAGMDQAQDFLDFSFKLLGRTSVWSPDPTMVSLGEYDTNYLVRAVVSQIGFGANKNIYALYQNAQRDDDGDPLSGDTSYKMVYENGNTPPVEAFWSLTVYNDQGFLVENPLNKYAVGSNTGLVADENGTITVHFATKQPEGVPEANWLPVPDGPFEVTLRMYEPDQEIIDAEWTAPPIVKE
ncbi:DUF1254 domain-containing protein [Parvularcula bermudensis]|uniref:DUF1254 domain-containing protein n=1 Tax=Parvularcula bermudensis TaxID=208216 RepID=UPI0002E19926|nr:DUF1254 domain-containing protein [Parvularcula bermudensis]